MVDASAPIVSLERCEEYSRARVRAAIRSLLAPLGGMKAFVRPGALVLLKPNLIVPRPVAAAVTTHPEIVRAVALEVREAGGKPSVGDSPAFGSALGVARKCGIAAVASELEMPLVDLGKRPCPRHVGEDSPFPWLSFGAAALEADVIINLPKIKTHGQMGMSLGTKNLFGCVAGKRKALLHFRNGEDHVRFGRMLVSVARFFKPALTIADGIVALERDGPTQGDPRKLGLLAAAADVVALDRVVIELLGVDPAMVPYMEAARQMEFGCPDLGRIRIVGQPLDSMRAGVYVRIAELTPIRFTLPRVIRSVFKQAVLLAKMKWRR